MFGGRVQADPTISTAVIDKAGIKVELQCDGTYNITVPVAFTLAKADTFSSFKVYFTDPNSKQVAPNINNYVQPKPGETKNFTLTLNTSVKGTWSPSAAFNYVRGSDNSPQVAQSDPNIAFQVGTCGCELSAWESSGT
jgi:hypothetical protein